MFVVSHERSGTHLTINSIVRNANCSIELWNAGEWFGPYDKAASRNHTLKRFGDQDGGQRVIKTHMTARLFASMFGTQDVLYVMRDPRDCMVSWWKYLQHDQARHRAGSDHYCESFSEFLRKPLSEFLRFSYDLPNANGNVVERWAEHVAGWASNRVTTVRYEGLVREFDETLRVAVAPFGIPLKDKLIPVGLHDMPSVLPRKGVIGDWINYIDKEDEQFIRMACESRGLNWSNITCPNLKTYPT